MSIFLRHTNCPKCGSRDNLAEYDDHFFCFGCKYTKQKTDLASIRKRIAIKDEYIMEMTSFKLTDEIPQEPLKWLLSYGITLSQIKEYGIVWNEDDKMLLLVNTPDYWQARTFGNHKVKYMSSGKKPLLVFGKGDTLICVEDVLSAIKIASNTNFCAMPLLGSSMSENCVQRILSDFKSVLVWLDRDKAKNAVAIARNLKQRDISASVIVSPKDPKEYNREELLEWLKNK